MDEPRALTILNSQGNFTFIWQSEDDLVVEKIVAKKLSLNYRFFIVGFIPYVKLVPSHKLIKDPDDIRDEDFKKFILNTYAEAARTRVFSMKESILCHDSKLISQSQSLAIKPIKRKKHGDQH